MQATSTRPNKSASTAARFSHAIKKKDRASSQLPRVLAKTKRRKQATAEARTRLLRAIHNQQVHRHDAAQSPSELSSSAIDVLEICAAQVRDMTCVLVQACDALTWALSPPNNSAPAPPTDPAVPEFTS